MSSRFILPFADVGSGIKPSSGAKLFFFETDGVTPKDTFSDQLSTPTPNANPVIADSNGVFGDIYIEGSYKVTLQDKNGSQVFGGAIVLSTGASGESIGKFTLTEAVENTAAQEGQIVQITDRADAQFSYETGQAPNTFDIVQCVGVPTLALVLRTKGITSALSIGCVLDGVTDDFAPLTRIHDLGLTYSLDGKFAYCSGTLLPKSGQTIYPFGGGMIKDTVGPLFRNDGSIDRFVIEDGGLWRGEDTADFIYMGGALGFGNGWTNCAINGVGSAFVTAFTLDNARRIELKGRWSAKFGLHYTNKSAENDCTGLNLIGRQTDSIGLLSIAGPDGYPEGLSYRGGMIFGFHLNVVVNDILELNFSGTELSGLASVGAGNTAQVILNEGVSGVCRGIYFENGCHLSGNGIEFGDGLATGVQEYRAIISGSSFRTMAAGADINLKKWARNITIEGNQHESTGADFCVQLDDKHEGIAISNIRPRGAYTRHVTVAGSDSKHLSVRDIINTGNLAVPFFFGAPVSYSGLEGLSDIYLSSQITSGVYLVTEDLLNVDLELATGTYQLMFRSNITAASGTCRFQTAVFSGDGGVITEVGGGGYSSQYIEVPDAAQRLSEVYTFTVTAQGLFTIRVTQERGSSTHSGSHNTIGLIYLG